MITSDARCRVPPAPTLYIDDDEVGSGTILIRPGSLCLVGDGRDSASPVTPQYDDRGIFEDPKARLKSGR